MIRMDNLRLPRQTFYSELLIGSRRSGRPLKPFKAGLKANLLMGNIEPSHLEGTVLYRETWKIPPKRPVSKQGETNLKKKEIAEGKRGH